MHTRDRTPASIELPGLRWFPTPRACARLWGLSL